MPGKLLTSARWLVLLTISAGTVACTGSDELKEPQEKPSPESGPAAVDFSAPEGNALPGGVRLGDQTDQHLAGVAASEDVVVAVGSDFSASVHLPLFLASSDGGEHWTRGRLDGPPVDAESPDSVAFGNGTFVAAGTGIEGRPVIWTSRDGDAWAREEPDSDVFKSTDDITGVSYNDDRFYVTGATRTPRGPSLSGALLWTSRDGTSWQRMDLRDRGLGALAGESAIEDVAVIDDQLVIAVSVTDRTAADQPDRVEIWRSENGGRMFRRDPTGRYFAGSYRAYAEDLIVANDELVLAASGDGLTEDTWDGVLMTGSANPDFWSALTPKALSTPGEDHPSVVLLLDNAYLAAANVADTTTRWWSPAPVSRTCAQFAIAPWAARMST